jgi:hypothetical protein
MLCLSACTAPSQAVSEPQAFEYGGLHKPPAFERAVTPAEPVVPPAASAPLPEEPVDPCKERCKVYQALDAKCDKQAAICDEAYRTASKQCTDGCTKSAATAASACSGDDDCLGTVEAGETSCKQRCGSAAMDVDACKQKDTVCNKAIAAKKKLDTCEC